MFGTTTTIVGLVLLGIASVCTILATAAIRCYSSNASSMDLFLLSVFTTLLMDCGILVGIQAALVLDDMHWSKPLCTFYVWAWVTLRFAEILSLLALSIDRAFILHLPTAKYKFKGTMGVKTMVLVIWIFAAFMGSIPIVGWSGVAFYKPLKTFQETIGYTDNCFYISYEIDHNYGVFTIITQIALFFSSILCLVDVHLQMKYYKTNTLFSIEAQGTDPENPLKSRNTLEVKARSHGHVTEFHGGHQVALAHENCRLACIIAFVSYLLNHVPYTVISLIGILTGMNSEHARVASLWFVLLDAIVLPQTLWLFNSRYRAAYRRIFKGLTCRQPFFCSGDLNTITLEGYLVRDEVPEILQNAQLAYIKKEDPAAFNHRSTSEPNLSDVVTDSSFGSTDDSHHSNGFPRACSLDSHLDEPTHENAEEIPTVAERDIQMSDVMKELNQNDQNIKHETPTENHANDGSSGNDSQEIDVPDTKVPEMKAVVECRSTTNVVSVELHLSESPEEGAAQNASDKPPIPPPRKKKQLSLSNQTSVSSTDATAHITPRQNSSENKVPVSPDTDNSSPCFTVSSSSKQKMERPTGSHREEWKKKMLKQHLPPEYIPHESRNEEEFSSDNDLVASVDLDEIVIDGILHQGDNQIGSVMSESLLVQSTYSVEERNDSISQPSSNSPVLTKQPKHPIVMAARISSVSSSVSSGVAYEEHDIDSILDKLSLASTFTDKDDAKINTWEKIEIRDDANKDTTNESDKENNLEKVMNEITGDEFKNSVASKSKKQKVNFKNLESTKNPIGDNKLADANSNKKFKMKHRLKLDKAEKKKAKYNQLNRAKEMRSKEKISRKRPNTNSLDRDALRTGEYFSADDICDFVFSRSTSIESSNNSKEDDTGKLEKYLYVDDKVWIPLSQNPDNWNGKEQVNENNDTAADTQLRTDGKQMNMKTSLSRQDAMESFTSNSSPVPEHPEADDDSPWIRRTQSEDNNTVTPKVAHAINTRNYHSQETDLV